MSKINKQIYDAIAISDASFTFGLSAVIVLGVMATAIELIFNNGMPILPLIFTPLIVIITEIIGNTLFKMEYARRLKRTRCITYTQERTMRKGYAVFKWVANVILGGSLFLPLKVIMIPYSIIFGGLIFATATVYLQKLFDEKIAQMDRDE